MALLLTNPSWLRQQFESPYRHYQNRFSSSLRTRVRTLVQTEGLWLKTKSKSKSKSRRKRVGAIHSSSSSSSGNEVYEGVYGPWKVEPSDVLEVILYRSGLVTTSLVFLVAASTALIPDDIAIKSVISENFDILYAIGAGGLGLSLVLIHIYVTPIKRTLQFLWGLGVVGSVVTALKFAAPVDQGLVEYVLDKPIAIWLVGPLFAALTGLVFKEGLCYGKGEAAALVFVIPALLLGHLSGVADDNVKLVLLVAWVSLFTLFAARKFTQPIKDDIGDKSVFMFNALPEEEKAAFLKKLPERTRK